MPLPTRSVFSPLGSNPEVSVTKSLRSPQAPSRARKFSLSRAKLDIGQRPITSSFRGRPRGPTGIPICGSMGIRELVCTCRVKLDRWRGSQPPVWGGRKEWRYECRWDWMSYLVDRRRTCVRRRARGAADGPDVPYLQAFWPGHGLSQCTFTSSLHSHQWTDRTGKRSATWALRRSSRRRRRGTWKTAWLSRRPTVRIRPQASPGTFP